jgi:hypothetical protein
MIARLKKNAARASRKAGLLTGGLLSIIVGLGILTWSAWLYLSVVTDPVTASAIIGGAYVGVGLLMIGTATLPSHDKAAPEPPAKSAQFAGQPGAQPPLMQAFLYGMDAGLAAQRK